MGGGGSGTATSVEYFFIILICRCALVVLDLERERPEARPGMAVTADVRAWRCPSFCGLINFILISCRCDHVACIEGSAVLDNNGQ